MKNLKTMTMQVIDSDPHGVKVCSLAGSSVTTFVVPWHLIVVAKALQEKLTRDVYFLVDDAAGRVTRAYAGKTTQGVSRLDWHYFNKPWWTKAVMLLAPDQVLTMDVISALESKMIDYLVSCNRCESDNVVVPASSISPYAEPLISQYFEDILFRMSLLGFALDDGQGTMDTQRPRLTAVKGESRAYATYDPASRVLTVLPGSEILMDNVPGTERKPVATLVNKRNELLTQGKIERGGDGAWRLLEPVTFSTPSAGVDFSLGKSNNGWVAWKDPSGRTLSELY